MVIGKISDCYVYNGKLKSASILCDIEISGLCTVHMHRHGRDRTLLLESPDNYL